MDSNAGPRIIWLATREQEPPPVQCKGVEQNTPLPGKQRCPLDAAPDHQMYTRHSLAHKLLGRRTSRKRHSFGCLSSNLTIEPSPPLEGTLSATPQSRALCCASKWHTILRESFSCLQVRRPK